MSGDLIWGKARNKMQDNLIAETDEERRLLERLKHIRESEEVQGFLLMIKSELEEKIGNVHFKARIKKNGSAIRKFRKGGYERASQMDDLCGVMIVTEDLSQVYLLVETIKKLLNKPQFLDLNDKTGNYGVPPLSYILKSEMEFNDVEGTVPFEIRVQEVSRFITIEATYYSIYKNDALSDDKWEINEVMLQIIRRQAQLDTGKCDNETKKKIKEEIAQLMAENAEIIVDNKQVVYEVWREYARVRFEYLHNTEIQASCLFDQEALTKIDSFLEKTFDEYYVGFVNVGLEKTDFPAGPEIEKTIQEILALDYQAVIERIRNTEKLPNQEEEGRS